MRRAWLIVAVGALAVIGGAALFASLFEFVDEEVEGSLRGEARRDPLLAARRLLTALGVPAEARPGISPLPPPDHLVLLLTPEGSLSIPESERLLAWVERGGRLVATAQAPLLERLGVEAVSEKEAAAAREEVAVERDPDEPLALAAAPGRSHRVELRGDRRFAVAQGTAELASGPPGAHTVVHLRHGRGRVTLLPERRFLENRELGRHQHAAFLWALVNGGGPPAGARLVGGFERPRLLAVLVRRAAPALASGGLLLLAWAAFRGARFGPRLPEPRVDRRSLLEHVRATGDFLWRKERAEDLVDSVRRGLERAAARLHPGWDRLSPGERAARLAGAAGLDRETVEWALAERPVGEPKTFARRIRILEQVRRSL